MKPKKSKPARRGASAARVQRRPRARVGRRIATALIVMAGVAVAFWFGSRHEIAAIPEPDLSGIDPGVAQLITKTVEELRAKPASADAWGRLGSVFWAYDFPDLARECLVQAERLNPEDARWPYFQSFLLEVEAPNKALDELRRTVRICGSTPVMPRLRLASLLAEDGQWTEADREIEKLLRDHPGFTPALLLKARSAEASGEIGAAIEWAERCAQDPRTARSAAILLAGLYFRAGDAAGATSMTRRIQSLPPDQPVPDPFQAEVTGLRNDPRILTERAHPLLAAGQLDDVKILVEELIREHGDYPETWLVAGRYHFLRKNLSAAAQCFDRHLELDPQSSQGHFQFGLVQLAGNDFAAAARTFSKATELKPDFGPAFYNYGFALSRNGDYTRAVPAFREAIRLNPERIDPYLMLADAALRLGDLEACARRLDEAEFVDPAHPGVRQLRQQLERASRRNSDREGSD